MTGTEKRKTMRHLEGLGTSDGRGQTGQIDASCRNRPCLFVWYRGAENRADERTENGLRTVKLLPPRGGVCTCAKGAFLMCGDAKHHHPR